MSLKMKNEMITSTITKISKETKENFIEPGQPFNKLKVKPCGTLVFEYLSFKSTENLERELENQNSKTFDLSKPRGRSYQITEHPHYWTVNPFDFPVKNKLFPVLKKPNFIENSILEKIHEIDSTCSSYESIVIPALKSLKDRLLDRKFKFTTGENSLIVSSKKSTSIGELNLRCEVKLSPNTVFFTIECLDLDPSLLQKYDYKNFNQKHCHGRFYLRDSAIHYKLAFHYPEFSKLHLSSLDILEDEIEKVFIPTLERNLDAEETNKDYTKVVVCMTEEEKEIVEKIRNILSAENSNYFRNRFYLNKIQMVSERYAYFYYLTNSEKLGTFEENCYNEVLEQIYELKERLAAYNIYFKLSEFSLDLFNWFSERPVFNYSKPLAQVLEIKDEQSLEEDLSTEPVLPLENPEGSSTTVCIKCRFNEKYKQAFNEKLYQSTRNRHIKRILADEGLMTTQEVNEDETELIALEKPQALRRLRLYKENRFFPIRKYHGIHLKDQACYSVAQKPFNKVFASAMNQEECLETIKKVLSLLKQFESKCSFIPCFDLDSIGSDLSGNLLLDLKNPNELSPEFQSPEVKSGRSSTLSSVYCFGKLLELVLLPLLDAEKFDYFNSLSKSCTQTSLIRRKKLQEISFD